MKYAFSLTVLFAYAITKGYGQDIAKSMDYWWLMHPSQLKEWGNPAAIPHVPLSMSMAITNHHGLPDLNTLSIRMVGQTELGAWSTNLRTTGIIGYRVTEPSLQSSIRINESFKSGASVQCLIQNRVAIPYLSLGILWIPSENQSFGAYLQAKASFRNRDMIAGKANELSIDYRFSWGDDISLATNLKIDAFRGVSSRMVLSYESGEAMFLSYSTGFNPFQQGLAIALNKGRVLFGFETVYSLYAGMSSTILVAWQRPS